jgi:hypothetical protein
MPDKPSTFEAPKVEDKQESVTAALLRAENANRPEGCQATSPAMPADARTNLVSGVVAELKSGSTMNDSSLLPSMTVAYSYGGERAVRELVRAVNMELKDGSSIAYKPGETTQKNDRVNYTADLKRTDKQGRTMEASHINATWDKPALEPEMARNLSMGIVRDINKGTPLQDINSTISMSLGLAESDGGRKGLEEMVHRVNDELIHAKSAKRLMADSYDSVQIVKVVDSIGPKDACPGVIKESDLRTDFKSNSHMGMIKQSDLLTDFNKVDPKILKMPPMEDLPKAYLHAEKSAKLPDFRIVEENKSDKSHPQSPPPKVLPPEAVRPSIPQQPDAPPKPRPPQAERPHQAAIPPQAERPHMEWTVAKTKAHVTQTFISNWWGQQKPE